METETARITARSRREALDWSLVLLSQGIEPIIDYGEQDARWELVVPSHDYENAREAIRLYQLENRRWPWRRELFQPGLLFDWGSLAWAALLVVFFWLDTRSDLGLAGVLDGAATSRGQWWRLFTAIWLHADLAHLAGNAVLGFVLLGLAMARYGTGTGLFAAYLAGIGGNLAAWLLSPGSHLSLGASGMVMGALGLLAIPLSRPRSARLGAAVPNPVGSSPDRAGTLDTGGPRPSQTLGARPRPTGRAMRYVVSGVLGGVLLFVLLGLSPGTDVVAHAGGFISGVLLGALMRFIPGLARKPTANLLAGLLFVVLVLWPWWLALRH